MVHIHCDIISLNELRDLPRANDGETADPSCFRDWLMRRWEHKEQLLAGFEQNGKFSSPQKLTDRVPQILPSELIDGTVLGLIPRNVFGQVANQLCVMMPAFVLFYWVIFTVI